MIFLDKPAVKIDIERDDILYFHYRKVNLADYPKVRYVVTPCSGYDHIDFDYCKKHGIKVIYLDDKRWLYDNVWATAEHTIYMMLTALKPHNTRDKGYNHELRNKVVGIIGHGRVGSQVHRLLDAFGAKVFHCDRDCDDMLTEMFYCCDIITIHLPLTEETKGFIKRADAVDFLKHGGIIINVGRQAIIEGESGDNERVYTQHKILETGHMAGFTQESRIATDMYVFNKLWEAISAD